MRGGRVGLVVLSLFGGALALSPTAGAATYASTTPISSPPSPGTGPALPYPSAIAVSGEAGTVTKVRVGLSDLFGVVRDYDVLLTGPGASSLLISDVCSVGVIPDFVHMGLTLDDDAPAAIPESTCSSGAPTGSWKPTNYDTADNFPGVSPPYPIGLGNFRGLSPNGLWQLYVLDDGSGGESISVGGWTLDLTTTGAPAVTPKKKCKKKHKRSASAAKKRCKKKRR